MKVVVVGAGVMGVTTAYCLQQRGCQVTVVEQRSGAAAECSQANGGFYSAGLSAPWSAPGAIGMALRSLFDPKAAFKCRPDFSVRQLRWVLQSMNECRAARFVVNRARLTRLALYARDCLRDIEAAEGIQYERGSGGILQLYRSPIGDAAAAGLSAYLQSMGIAFRVLAKDELLALEPALTATSPTGALHLPDDSAGDCAVFTRRLADITQARGATYLWNTRIDRVVTERSGHSRVRALAAPGGDITADAYVFAAGAYSAQLLAGVAKLPVYPIKGYSLTSTITRPDRAPQRSLFDYTARMGFARLGNTLRVSGIAEVVGHDMRLPALRREQMAAQLEQIFPGAVDPSTAVYWTGLRPATPDGVPIIARTDRDNLFVNAGHGGSGWSLSCGAGKLMADIVTGRKSALNALDYGLRSH